MSTVIPWCITVNYWITLTCMRTANFSQLLGDFVGLFVCRVLRDSRRYTALWAFWQTINWETCDPLNSTPWMSLFRAFTSTSCVFCCSIWVLIAWRDAMRATYMPWRCLRVSVCLSVCLSVCHKSEFYKNGWTNRARFGTKLPFSRFKLCRKDILEPPKIGARTSLWNFVPSS